jgi:hypothetical protein
MKNFKSIFIIITCLVSGTVISLSAQSREAKSSSARAAYGVIEEGKQRGKKKQKPRKVQKQKQAKIAREKSPAYRKRNNWAG